MEDLPFKHTKNFKNGLTKSIKEDSTENKSENSNIENQEEEEEEAILELKIYEEVLGIVHLDFFEYEADKP